ncbi:MAG: SCO family protein [Candidatus Sulfotelmatobacter sp.]
MIRSLKSFSPSIAVLCLCTLLAACHHPTVKRYPMKGKVISIDQRAAMVNIDTETIPGFMEAMMMPYTIKPASMLDQLKPGDTITAEVVVEPDKYWLENVVVTGHSTPATQPTSTLHLPSAGEEVPDFKLVNQDGKNISLRQYRGQTLLVTLIYTRCPFPDYCPRVSREFAEIDRQLRADPARYGKTHLLSISFDPAHDTPKVLRAYGFDCAKEKDSALFSHWEFAAIPEKELPEFANYFALSYKEEGGLITHSLSTTVIAPDGKIQAWYHGADWLASDLLHDVAAAHAS